MARYNYERLTALDNTFLVMESADTPMHVASVGIFEPEPLQGPDGGVVFDRITAHLTARLHKVPRYRQKLAYIPFEGHPVWVDDDRFNINYHLRHTALPSPGDARQLKRLCARVMSQQLDRGKPLWETWIVEGLEDGAVAMISKVHHCMVDGMAGGDLLAEVLSLRPDAPVDEVPRWIPRPAPTPQLLLRDEIVARLQAPWNATTRLMRHPATVAREIRSGLQAVGEAIGAGMHRAAETPLNEPIGPHRRFDWAAMDIAVIRAIRTRLGGSLNDVVLATVAGAVRRFFERRGIDPRGIEFRAFVPVSVRTAAQRGTMGNHVAAWTIALPIAERDPVRALQAISEATTHLKSTGVARGTEILTEVAEWTSQTLAGMAMRLAVQARPFNLVVTNVPGPPVPLYLLGARMREIYPMVPLSLNQGLGVALFSNAGRLFWGFNADWDLVPDLHDFVAGVEAAFADLCGAASNALPTKRVRASKQGSPRRHERRSHPATPR